MKKLTILIVSFLLVTGIILPVETILTLETVNLAGWVLTDNLVAANADGNYWTNSEQDTYLVVLNGAVADCNVTVVTTQTFQGGNVTLTNPVVTVEQDEVIIIGPFTRSLFNNATGVHVTYDTVATVTVAAVQIANL